MIRGKTSHGRFFAMASLLAAAAVLASSPSHAMVLNFGSMICQFTQQNSGMPAFFSWMAYIAGTFFVVKAYLQLRHWTEDPQRHPISKAMLYAFAGSSCLVLPSFAGMLLVSIFANAGWAAGGAPTCVPGAVVNIAVVGGLDQVANNFVNNIAGPAFMGLGFLCYALGVLLIFRGLNKMAKYNTDPKAYSLQAILGNMFIGALLIAAARTKDVWMASLFGIGAGPLTFAAVGAGTINWAALGIAPATAVQFDTAYIAATTFFQVIGLIAFIRGWLIMKAIAEGVGNHTTSQGLTHIIGGVFCMNIIIMLRAAFNTFGIATFLT